MPKKTNLELENQETTEVEGEDFQEKYQRALADLENLRKRHDQERQNIGKFGREQFLIELLPVVDNFYRATEHVPAEQKESAWVTGIQYIQKQLIDVLGGQGVVEIPVKVGDAFDSNTQEALGTVISEEMDEDHILEIKNKGYMLHDRVLRPVQVIVSKKA